jgi:TRAP-type C4-dicarboxylate transport system permease large subunit
MPLATPHVSLLAIVGIGALIAWRVYARVRRSVGRQRFRPVRSWISAVLFPLLVVALLVGSFTHPLRAVAELAGVGIGIALAIYGLRLTKFEDTPAGTFYTPNAHVGIALSLLFVARVAYRLIQLYLLPASLDEPPATFVRSPLTLLMVGTLAGYYAWYAFGLLRRQRALSASRT